MVITIISILYFAVFVGIYIFLFRGTKEEQRTAVNIMLLMILSLLWPVWIIWSLWKTH